jgi:TBC1 domain family protein 5
VAKFVKGEDLVTKTPLKRDPLSKDTGNGQSTSYFENHELKNQIKIDIQRTYNEYAFFSNQRVKSILTNVLFLWAKDNGSISYIQGMNEVAASVIYVYYQECLGKDVAELYGESE